MIIDIETHLFMLIYLALIKTNNAKPKMYYNLCIHRHEIGIGWKK